MSNNKYLHNKICYTKTGGNLNRNSGSSKTHGILYPYYSVCRFLMLVEDQSLCLSMKIVVIIPFILGGSMVSSQMPFSAIESNKPSLQHPSWAILIYLAHMLPKFQRYSLRSYKRSVGTIVLEIKFLILKKASTAHTNICPWNFKDIAWDDQNLSFCQSFPFFIWWDDWSSLG